MSTLASPELEIYEGGQEDLSDVMVVMLEAFDPEYGEAWSKSQCSGLLLHPGVWISLVYRDNVAAGFSLARMIADEAELLLIGVRPRFRGEGIGGTLLERVCISAASMGAKKLHLEMREGNEAEHLYYKAGFEGVGRRKKYYRGRSGVRYDAITLSLSLDSQQ